MRALAWLLTPDGFDDDPVGFAFNQLGHVALGAALAWALGAPAALALCVGWEIVHLRRGGALWDGAEDFGFVAAGALALALHPVAAIGAAPFLAAGWLRRRST